MIVRRCDIGPTAARERSKYPHPEYEFWKLAVRPCSQEVEEEDEGESRSRGQGDK